MMQNKQSSTELTRRSIMKNSGLAGVAGLAVGFGGSCSQQSLESGRNETFQILSEQVEITPIVDTHEHLLEESARIKVSSDRIKANDWSFLFSHYLNSDLSSSGMTKSDRDKFFGPEMDPIEKWALLAPYWPRVRNTGYGQAVEIAINRIYGIEEVSEKTVKQIQDAYLATIKPGFYSRILKELGGIESCQVNSLERPFYESAHPAYFMQDLSILGMHMGPDFDIFAPPTGIEVRGLQDWHAVIDWWFEKYGPYAVAVKTQAAYSRNIDFQKVPLNQVERVFKRVIDRDQIPVDQKKNLEDHLFWYCVKQANKYELPIKIHTGYYAGDNYMPLGRLQNNAGSASDLCRMSPETRFVFMHIDYPFYEDLIAVAKHYTNCYIDMCWAWIISPVASVNFLKQYLVTAPSNKVLTFGGDYIPVEPVLGHVCLARTGIARALTQLVEEGWLTLDSAASLIEPIMRGNALGIFNLEQKKQMLQKTPWT